MTNETSRNEDLLLYVISKLHDCQNSGAVLLNKVLYYIDNIHYLKYGRSVSGFTYIKQDNGPTPMPSQFIPLREKLLKEGKIESQEIEKYGHVQKKLIAKTPYSIGFFSAEEIELIDMVIDDCKPFTASKISDISHQELAWKLANKFEELPLNTYLLTKSEVDENDIEWARTKLESTEPLLRN